MKKFKLLLISLLLFAFIVPFSVKAEEDTVGEKSKINVYIFRGEGCGFCAKALEFFGSIEEEYGKYYNLVEYEVWNNAENAALMESLASYLGTTIDGVPFIIVGEKTYPGFQESWGEEIKQRIVDEYNKSEDDRTDIIKNYESGKTVEKSNDSIISIVAVIALAGIVAFVIYARKGNNVTNKKDTILDDISDSDFVEEEREEKVIKTKTNKSKSDAEKNSKNTKKTSEKSSTTKKKRTSKK